MGSTRGFVVCEREGGLFLSICDLWVLRGRGGSVPLRPVSTLCVEIHLFLIKLFRCRCYGWRKRERTAAGFKGSNSGSQQHHERVPG